VGVNTRVTKNAAKIEEVGLVKEKMRRTALREKCPCMFAFSVCGPSLNFSF
jgi:hypothetical protein